MPLVGHGVRHTAVVGARPGDPGGLLDAARESEVGLRLRARTAALDELQALLDAGAAPPAPDGRNWQLELDAERALDHARLLELTEARALAERLRETADDCPIAYARATEALGRAHAWEGTDAATRAAEPLLLEAAKRYADLGFTEWQGYALFWLGNAVFFQNGAVPQAVDFMREALDVLAPDSPRRPAVLSFLADALGYAGRWDEAEAVLDQAVEQAAKSNDLMGRAYVAWSRARMASCQGDARKTARLVAEAERDSTDWFDIHAGATFLADAAEMLDRVGDREGADEYLRRAIAKRPTDEFVHQARAVLLARRGDPDEALRALHSLVRGAWLEKRWVWRHTLFEAFATLRAGRSDAGRIAARAFEQAAANGGIEVAACGEPELVRALAPLAEAAGSVHARTLLAPGATLVVRLFGTTRVSHADGEVALPPGQAAELVRMLAVSPHGMSVDAVLEWFFEDLDPATGRHRLRQVLSRLRSVAGDVVVRDGESLRLAPAWVDVHAFREASDRALATHGSSRVEAAHTALAIWSGPPLPNDPYAGWATAPREQLRRRYLALLDLVATDATERGSIDEALRALAVAREEDPYDESRYERAAELLVRAGRRGAAVQLVRQAEAALAEIAVPLPPGLRRMVGG